MKILLSAHQAIMAATATAVIAGGTYMVTDLNRWNNEFEAGQLAKRQAKQVSKHEKPADPTQIYEALSEPTAPETTRQNYHRYNDPEPEYTGPKRFAAKGVDPSFLYDDYSAEVDIRNMQISQAAMLYAGTQIELVTVTPVDVKYLSAGQTIDLRVKYDVVVDRKIVIPAGSVAKAQVNDARKKRLFKKSQICIEPKYVQTTEGQYIPLSSRPAYFQSKDNYPLSAGATLFANIAATSEVQSQLNF